MRLVSITSFGGLERVFPNLGRVIQACDFLSFIIYMVMNSIYILENSFSLAGA